MKALFLCCLLGFSLATAFAAFFLQDAYNFAIPYFAVLFTVTFIVLVRHQRSKKVDRRRHRDCCRP